MKLARATLLVVAAVMLAGGFALAATDDARIKATTFEADSPQTGDALTRCGRGKRAVGGGIVPVGSPDGFAVNASGPLDKTGTTLETGDGDVPKQWYGAAYNNSGLDDRTVKVMALCAPDSNAKLAGTREVGAEHGHGAEAVAICGPGKRAVGGGVVQSGSPDNLFVNASGPLDRSASTLDTQSGDVPKMWYAAVFNLSGSDRTFRVYAVCAADSKAEIKATRMSVDDGATDEAFARCGRGKRALGGGIVQSGDPFRLNVAASGPLDASGSTQSTQTDDVAKQWYAAVENGSGIDNRVFKVLAICE